MTRGAFVESVVREVSVARGYDPWSIAHEVTANLAGKLWDLQQRVKQLEDASYHSVETAAE